METSCENRESRIKTFIEQVNITLEKSLHDLERIWHEIGFPEKEKQKRNEKAFFHFSELFKQMISGEEELKGRKQKNVDDLAAQLSQLCTELGLPPHDIDSGLNLRQKETELRSKVDELKKEKQERLATLRQLRTEEQQFCEKMSLPQHELNFIGCPTTDQVKELEQNIVFLTAEYKKRFEFFTKLHASIVRYWEELDEGPTADLEANLLTDTSKVVLSSENLSYLEDLEKKLNAKHKHLLGEIDALKEKAKALWSRLDVPKEDRDSFLQRHAEATPRIAKAFQAEIARLEELKRQHMEKFIVSLRKELTALWDKCFYGESQRREFPQAFDDEYTEASLDAHEHHVQLMKSFYDDNKELFDMVHKREGIWVKKLEFENRPTDFNRLNNRGGALLKEEKLRKAIEKELPKLEHDLVKRIEQWEEEHETYFLVHGSRYVSYLATQKEEYEKDKLEKKNQKQREKENVLKEEMVFGSKPRTPQKRPYPVTPSKVNVKVRKVDLTHCTSLTPSKFVHSSICPSPRLGTTGSHRLLRKPPKSMTKANKTTGRRLSKSKSRRRSSRLALKNILSSSKLNKTLTKSSGNSTTSSSEKPSTASHSSKEDSLISYKEFAGGIGSPHCRSSFVSVEHGQEELV